MESQATNPERVWNLGNGGGGSERRRWTHVEVAVGGGCVLVVMGVVVVVVDGDDGDRVVAVTPIDSFVVLGWVVDETVLAV